MPDVPSSEISPELAKYSIPISQEAVDQAVELYQKEAAKEAKKNKEKMMDRGPLLVGNRLPPLQVPAHVRRLQTLQYFKDRKQQQKTEKPRREQHTTTGQIQEQRHRQDDDDDDDEEEEERGHQESEQDKFDDDDDEEEEEDDEDPLAVSQSAAEQALREAIEASELSQRRKEEQEQAKRATMSPPRKEIVMAASQEELMETSPPEAATPAPSKHAAMVTPSPVSFSHSTLPPPSSDRPVYPKATAPTKKMEYHRVNQEVRSFDDAFQKMLDNRAPDWKQKRRWSYVCM
jgi:hypothetical protein